MSISTLISKLWQKQGIKSVEDLNPEEKVEFERWQQIIEGSEVTVDKLRLFCESQVRIIEGACNGVTPLSYLQQASLHIYLSLLNLIDAPELERKNLEHYLTDLIKQ